MVGAYQPPVCATVSRRNLVLGGVPKHELGGTQAMYSKYVLEGDMSQAHDHPGGEQLDLARQVGPAIVKLIRRRSISGRYTATGGCEVQALEPEGIISSRGFGVCSQAGAEERRVEEAPRGVSRELPARTVGPVGSRCQADNQDPCQPVAKTGNRFPPIFPIAVRLSFFARNSFAPCHESGALAAGDDPPIEALEIHSVILL